MTVTTIAEYAALGIEAIGIAVIAFAAVVAVASSIASALKGGLSERDWTVDVRHRLARGILLGLEFLVAADIIHSAAVELTLETVGVLAIIVLIRTFLSFSLELEITGSWPWARKTGEADQ